MSRDPDKLKRVLPYAIALFSFFAVCAVYFYPQFSGKEINMHDVTQYYGMTEEITKHREMYGEDPQWTGSMFGGMPAPLINMNLDTPVFKTLNKVFEFMGRPGSMIFIAMTCFFVMLLLFGVNPWVGIIPSLAYGLSTYFFIIIGAGHITKLLACAYAPLMVGSVAYTFRKNIWLGGALTALFGGLEIYCNHPQITYYFLFIVLAYWINEGVKAYKTKTLARFGKITAVLAVAGILAVGSNGARLWYTNEAGKYSIRGGSELVTEGDKQGGLDIDYLTGWSYGKMESFNMFIPNFTGGTDEGGFSDDGEVARVLSRYGQRSLAKHLPGYWGTQPITFGPTYLGAVLIYLFVLGMFLLRGRCKWWVFAVTIVALFLAWGKNFILFTELFYNFFPGYNKFRTVAMILVIAEWSVPFLAAIVLNKVWKSNIKKEEVKKGLLNALYVTGGVALFFLVAGGTIFDFSAAKDAQFPDDVIAAMESERASMFRADCFRSLIFVILTALAVWGYNAGKIKKWLFAVLLAGLVCADLVPVNMRYLPQSKFVDKKQNDIRPTPADIQILADTEPGFRVWNATTQRPFDEAVTSYFHRSIGGYHGAKMARYQDIIERHLYRQNWNVINMLNTKYILTPDPHSGEPVANLNPDAYGAAWLVQDIVLAEDPEQEINALNDIDTRTMAVVNKRFADLTVPGQFAADSSAYIRITDYRANYQKYEYSSAYTSAAVFSEIYYDRGWKAYIDGVEIPHFRADYILRGLVVPAGTHTIEFRYRAEGFGAVYGMTIAISVLILLLVGAAAVAAFMCNRNKTEHNAG